MIDPLDPAIAYERRKKILEAILHEYRMVEVVKIQTEQRATALQNQVDEMMEDVDAHEYTLNCLEEAHNQIVDTLTDDQKAEVMNR